MGIEPESQSEANAFYREARQRAARGRQAFSTMLLIALIPFLCILAVFAVCAGFLALSLAIAP